MNKFSIVADTTDDGCIGLTGQFDSEGFKGFGEGWFNLVDVLEFCEKLENFATSVTGEVELIASQSKSDGTEYLERFALRWYVISKTGILGLHISLTEYPYTDCRPQEISRVSGELKLEPQSVLKFTEQLRKLSSGKLDSVDLVGRQ